MLRIVTDGAADIPEEWIKEFEIDVCPINIHFGKETFLQGVDLDNEGFYQLVEETKKIPKTSQPNPQQFANFYKKIALPGDTILSIHVTSKLSGTYNSAVAAAREVADLFKVLTFDSLTGSMGLGFMCRQARIMERAGLSLEMILAKLENIRDTVRIVLALDTLEYARMCGRVSTMQAAMASLLNVKPIAVVRNGQVFMTEKVRTRKASIQRLIQIVKEEMANLPLMVAVLHARAPKEGKELLELASVELNVKEIILHDLSISLAANFGPGTLGIVVVPLE